MFCKDLRRNSDYFPRSRATGFYNPKQNVFYCAERTECYNIIQVKRVLRSLSKQTELVP